MRHLRYRWALAYIRLHNARLDVLVWWHDFRSRWSWRGTDNEYTDQLGYRSLSILPHLCVAWGSDKWWVCWCWIVWHGSLTYNRPMKPVDSPFCPQLNRDLEALWHAGQRRADDEHHSQR